MTSFSMLWQAKKSSLPAPEIMLGDSRVSKHSVCSFILTSFVKVPGWSEGVILLKILVCMKQVPQKDAPLKLNDTGSWIREDVSYEVNEPDAYALEAALRQKEKYSGEVVVITSGLPRKPGMSRDDRGHHQRPGTGAAGVA